MHPPTQNTDLTDILNFSRAGLESWLAGHTMDAYRAGQVMVWLYKHQADEFAVMTNLSKAARELLAVHFTIPRLERVAVQVSADGCRKYLFGLRDGHRIESVLIPEGDYATLCVSSQVGCAMDCRFCLTAKGGFVRNLGQGEILAQVRDIRRDLDDPARLTNLVFMGMGEPLANLDNLIGALEIITDSDVGLAFAPRRVTVSTAGLVPKMLEFGRRTRASLAVSLNAADDRTRSRLMPINRRYPLQDAARRLPGLPAAAGPPHHFRVRAARRGQRLAGGCPPALPAAAADPLQGEPHPLQPPRRQRVRAPLRRRRRRFPGGAGRPSPDRAGAPQPGAGYLGGLRAAPARRLSGRPDFGVALQPAGAAAYEKYASHRVTSRALNSGLALSLRLVSAGDPISALRFSPRVLRRTKSTPRTA